MTKPMLIVVLENLAARKGTWREISRQLDPVAPDSYYSWLTKLAQGTIREPSVNKIQRLYDYFQRIDRSIATVSQEAPPNSESDREAA